MIIIVTTTLYNHEICKIQIYSRETQANEAHPSFVTVFGCAVSRHVLPTEAGCFPQNGADANQSK